MQTPLRETLPGKYFTFALMRFLLTTLNSKYIHPNLAIRLLYHLNKDKADLSWQEFTIKEDKDAIANFCADFDVVCFSCYIWNIMQTLEVCTLLKQKKSGIKILLGGPEVSYEWENVISLSFIDFIITGEGELPFSKFVEQYPNITNIPNLVSKNDGKINYTEKSETFDLTQYADCNPYQYDDLATLKTKVLYIETSRGCPYKCEFCLASLDNKVRYLPLETIKSQLLFLMQHGRVIKFLDRTFNIKRDFTLEIFQFILNHHQVGNVFQFEITADILHPDIIRFIQEKVPKNLFRFEIGIQSVNTQANLAVSRKQNFDKTKDIIKQIENKIELHLDLIVGLPHDYFEDIHKGFNEVFALFAPELQLGFLKLLKGTPVREKYTEYNFVYDALPPYQLIESKFLSKKELQDILILEEALEIYWNKKRIIHTLKYVSSYLDAFEFLWQLGLYYEQKMGNQSVTQKAIYQTAYYFILENFETDQLLQQLFVIDYLLQYKVKPETDWLSQSLEKWNFSQEKSTNKHQDKFRSIAFDIPFDWEKFIDMHQIQSTAGRIEIRYQNHDVFLSSYIRNNNINTAFT